MSEDMRKMIDKIKNFKQFVNENYMYSYYDNPNESGTFNPEYYLFSKLDGEGYAGDYNEFRNSDDYESYIHSIQNTIDEIKSLKFPLRIYRGLNEKEVDLLKFHQHKSGNISWTYNLNVAKEFANGGIILTGVVNYDDVDVQTTINRNVLHRMLDEDEIVLKDNKLIKDLKQFIKTTIREFLNENHNSHLVEVIPNKYVYHTSNPIFRDKISKEGLMPKGKSETWLSDTNIDGEVIFAVNSDNKEDWWDSTYDDDIYKIDTTNLNNKWYNDPNFDLEDKRIITFENIPSNSIKLIYKGTGSDTLNESINIETPSTDEYNDIIVNGEKVGYIILSPARKEYYWVDVNLPNPLAIVDIKILNQFRGKNYMKETMNWLYNFAKKNGYKSLFLRIDDDSEISQDTLFKIYQKYGFSVYRTTDDEDDVFMYKLL